MTQLRPNFWQNYRLDQLTHDEWEALCDGCGMCCLVKFLDEDDPPHMVEYTNVACKLLDCATGACSNYGNRHNFVPDCITLTYDQLPEMLWLPNSCAYKRLYLNQGLPEWHVLITGDKQVSQQAMQQAGIGVAGRCIHETNVSDDDLEDYLVTWVTAG